MEGTEFKLSNNRSFKVIKAYTDCKVCRVYKGWEEEDRYKRRCSQR